MPPVQTTYGDSLALGKAGMVANMVPGVFISRTVENAAGLAFGVACSQGALDNGVKDYDDDVVGLVVRERSLPAEQNKFNQYDTARIMTKGAMIVTASVAVVAGDPVYAVAGGALAKAAGAGNTLIPNARWETTTTAGGQLAVVRLA